MLKFSPRPAIRQIVPRGLDRGLPLALSQARRTSGMTGVDARIRKILEVVLRELRKPYPIGDLAAPLRLSPSRFEHIFKRETGYSFKAFLRVARLAKAKDMLGDCTLRVKEVAAAVGYLDVSHFVRDFRRQYGRRPSQLKSPFS